MKYPNLEEEKKLWKRGYKYIVGLDEAGRGALAGPVVAAAVMVKIPNFQFLISKQVPSPKFPTSNSKQTSNSKFPSLRHVWDLEHWDLFRNLNLGFRISKLRDSKQLSKKAREKFFEIIKRDPRIEWGIGEVSEKIIDKINILEATKLAMRKAIKNLEKKLSSNSSSRKKQSRVDFLILDGNFKIDIPIFQKSIIKADEKVFSCAISSILAKVWRDRIMSEYDKKYPQYQFKKNKGYLTEFHLQMLKKYGPCKIHRKSFKPLKA